MVVPLLNNIRLLDIKTSNILVIQVMHSRLERYRGKSFDWQDKVDMWLLGWTVLPLNIPPRTTHTKLLLISCKERDILYTGGTRLYSIKRHLVYLSYSTHSEDVLFVVCPFVLFLFAIVLSPLLLLTDSDYHLLSSRSSSRQANTAMLLAWRYNPNKMTSAFCNDKSSINKLSHEVVSNTLHHWCE